MNRLALLTSAVWMFQGSNCFAQEGVPPDYRTKAVSGFRIGDFVSNQFGLFATTSILSDGETFFVAESASGEQAFASEQQVVLLTNTPVGGAPSGTVIDFLFEPVINVQREVIMAPILSGPSIDSTNDTGVVFYNGALNIEVQEGDPLPDPNSSESCEFFFGLRNNDAGDHAYTCSLTSSAEQAIYITPAGGTPHVVQVTGEVIGNERLESVSSPTLFAHASRSSALYLRKWEDVVNNQVSRAELAWRLMSTPPTFEELLILQTGDAGFGLPEGTTVKELFVPKANDNGQLGIFVAFEGAAQGESLHLYELDGPNITGGRSVAKTSDSAPGLPMSTFTFFQNFVVNASGEIAFTALVDELLIPSATASNQPQEGAAPIAGIWFEDAAGTLQLAAHNGMHAPGLDSGATIEGVNFPAFNDLNQVAFKSALAGPGVETFVNDEALWATDPNGVLQLIARTGDPFDVDDDPEVEDLRTINDIGVIANSGGTGGESTSFNNAGQLAFVLGFTDSTSGVFVASWPIESVITDLDGDGNVDGRDLLLIQSGDPSLIPMWEQDFGDGVPEVEVSRTVPEPATCLLLSIILLRPANRVPRNPDSRRAHGNRGGDSCILYGLNYLNFNTPV